MKQSTSPGRIPRPEHESSKTLLQPRDPTLLQMAVQLRAPTTDQNYRSICISTRPANTTRCKLHTSKWRAGTRIRSRAQGEVIGKCWSRKPHQACMWSSLTIHSRKGCQEINKSLEETTSKRCILGENTGAVNKPEKDCRTHHA